MEYLHLDKLSAAGDIFKWREIGNYSVCGFEVDLKRKSLKYILSTSIPFVLNGPIWWECSCDVFVRCFTKDTELRSPWRGGPKHHLHLIPTSELGKKIFIGSFILLLLQCKHLVLDHLHLLPSQNNVSIQYNGIVSNTLNQIWISLYDFHCFNIRNYSSSSGRRHCQSWRIKMCRRWLAEL